MDPGAAAAAILQVVENRDEWMKIVVAGEERLQELPQPSERLESYQVVLSELVQRSPRRMLNMGRA